MEIMGWRIEDGKKRVNVGGGVSNSCSKGCLVVSWRRWGNLAGKKREAKIALALGRGN